MRGLFALCSLHQAMRAEIAALRRELKLDMGIENKVDH
jgi:hypothetical protein